MAKPGRPKGSIDKNTIKAQACELARSMGIDPLEILLHFAAGNWESLGYKQGHKLTQFGEQDIISAETRMSAAREAVKYVYPALKSMEHKTGDEGFRVVITDYGKNDG